MHLKTENNHFEWMTTNSITLDKLEMYENDLDKNDKTYIGYYENSHEMKSIINEENDEFIIELP